MSKTSKSFSLETRLAEIVDEMPGKNSDVVNKALRRFLITDEDSLQDSINSLEKEREKKRIEKQQKEQEIWELDDRIERLRDLKSQSKAVEETRKAIGMEKIMSVAKIVKQNKYDPDPRADSEPELIEKHTEIILKETEANLDRDKVEKTLKTFINV